MPFPTHADSNGYPLILNYTIPIVMIDPPILPISHRATTFLLTKVLSLYTLIYMATLQKKTSRGHTYWQIVESRRVDGKPRPVVLMHLGTAQGLLRRLQEDGTKPVKAKIIQFGALAALWNMAEQLDIVGTIDRRVGKRNQGLSCGQYILLAALNRAVAASSKASLYQWYRNTVLYRLLPVSKGSLASQRF